MAQTNVLTDTGRNILTGRIKGVGSGPGSSEPKYLAIATGSGVANRTDTALATETGTRVAGTSSQVTTSVAGDTYSVQGTITVGAATAVLQAANFDASSAGNIFVKSSFDVINLQAGDSLSLTINLQFA